MGSIEKHPEEKIVSYILCVSKLPDRRQRDFQTVTIRVRATKVGRLEMIWLLRWGAPAVVQKSA